MTYKDLIVHVDASPEGLARLRLAANIAQGHQAYLTGVFVKPPIVPPVPVVVALGAYAGVPETDRSRLHEADLMVAKAAESCEAEFRRELERAGIKGEWRVLDDASLHAIAPEAGYADLVIIGQVRPGAEGVSTDLPGEIALACGRPVLVVPAAGKVESVGERIMIAWKRERESIRAVNDALPFLVRAKFVALFAVDPVDGAGLGGTRALDAIGHHLARHGIRAEKYVMTAPDRDVGQAVLARANEFDSDLIVMGAYGHARLRELVFGGATHAILRTSTIPVLMSH
jgi:nucleotide-binding universal stress UspA family protein